MRHLIPQSDWPQSYVQSFANDRVEVYGDSSDRQGDWNR